jgi:Derlin-2/3
MSDIWHEIDKIPPVTRSLVGSSLAVTLPTLLQVVSPYKLVFIRELVTKRWELWRLYTNFFLGGE